MGITATSLHPNYTLPVTTVYVETASKILDSDPSNVIDLLSCVNHEQPLIYIPSWVLDWTLPRQTVLYGYRQESHGVYQATRDSKIG